MERGEQVDRGRETDGWPRTCIARAQYIRVITICRGGGGRLKRTDINPKSAQPMLIIPHCRYHRIVDCFSRTSTSCFKISNGSGVFWRTWACIIPSRATSSRVYPRYSLASRVFLWKKTRLRGRGDWEITQTRKSSDYSGA